MLSPQPCPPQPARTPLPSRRIALAALALSSAAVVAWQWRSGIGRLGVESTAPPAVGDDVCVVAPPTPYDPASGKPLVAPREVPADARCPVCGMYPARSRAWAGQVIFANGDAFFFDSPLSLMVYLANVSHYTRGRTASAIVARYVTDMDTGAWVDTKHAVYVAGSSALGPMRAGNLPAFGDHSAAQRFVQARGGRMLRLDAIDALLLASLAPKRGISNGQHGH